MKQNPVRTLATHPIMAGPPGQADCQPLAPATESKPARFALLFWFYKDPGVCVNHLQILRRLNPAIPVYGLYGGPGNDAGAFRGCCDLLHDCYTTSAPPDPLWRWRNGDLLLREWYQERGRFLPFDLLAIVQWDLLLLAPIDTWFAGMRDNDVFFSSARPVDALASWFWTSDPKEKPSYEEFRRYLSADCHYYGSPWCCEFVMACLPRLYFELWLKIGRPAVGYIEYKLPTYAKMFGFDFHRCIDLDTFWFNPADHKAYNWRVALTARKEPVHLLRVIAHKLSGAKGRAFHPYVDKYPESTWDWIVMPAGDIIRIPLRWLGREWRRLALQWRDLRSRFLVATGPARRRLGLRKENLARLFRT